MITSTSHRPYWPPPERGNPLRRGTDRVEAALRLILILLLVVAVPAAAVAAGRWADRYALHQAQAQRAVDHQVTAVLLEDAPATGIPNPYTNVQTTWVPGLPVSALL